MLPHSICARWYVFIATPEGEILGQCNAEELGSPLGRDAQDLSFMATRDGIRLTHEHVNPVTGEVRTSTFGTGLAVPKMINLMHHVYQIIGGLLPLAQCVLN